MKYDFSKINDEEFEDLFKDILKVKLNRSFRTFSKGKDGGIDVISIDNKSSKIIGQAKHYLKSSLSQLINELEIKEKPKVDNLKPDRYVLALSKELTVGGYNKILNIFAPYLKQGEDIYDTIKIAEVLDSNDKLNEKWYKLWMPTKEVIDKILNNSENAITSFYKEKICKEIMLFVETVYYREAVKILEKENVIIIHGNPGTGKTTLANMLTYQMLVKDYKLRYVMSSELSNINNIINIDDKEIILVDDFLGSNILEMESGKENVLSSLINLCKYKNNKKLILVTRTVLYNRAKNEYEKFNRVDNQIDKLKIDTSKMTLYEKAKLLYNHLYLYEINNSDKYQAFICNRLYLKIINSKNYIPRIISEIVENVTIKVQNNNDIINMIEYSLSNPNNIWEYYYNGLSFEEKELLKLLAIFNMDVDIEILEDVFNKIYIELCKKYNLAVKNNCFRDSIKILSESLIRIEYTKERLLVNLANPSIRDYIIYICKDAQDKMGDYINTNIYIEQLLFLHEIVNDTTKKNIVKFIDENYIYLKCISNKSEKVFNFLTENEINSKSVKFLYKNFFIIKGNKLINQTIKNILKLVQSDCYYYKRVFIVYEYKRMTNNILNNIIYKEDLDVFLDICDNIFRRYSWIDTLENEIRNSIESCYETELDKNYIYDDFCEDDINDKEFIEEKLKDLHWKSAEKYLDDLPYNLLEKIKNEEEIQRLFDKRRIFYDDIYEYWYDNTSNNSNEDDEMPKYKSENELIIEMFEKK